MPGAAGDKGGDNTSGMSEQETAIVKAVRRTITSLRLIDILIPAKATSRCGELCGEERDFWRSRFCSWGNVWPFHVKCTSRYFSRTIFHEHDLVSV